MEKNINNVIEIIKRFIDNPTIDLSCVDEKLTDLGMNSMTFIQIVVALEEAFCVEIPDEKLLISEMETMNNMLDVITHSPSV